MDILSIYLNNTNLKFMQRLYSKDSLYQFLNSDFDVIIRDDARTIEDTFVLVEKAFRLGVKWNFC